MTSLTSSQTHVGCLVANVVLGKGASGFQKEVERLLSNNGPEWLVSRHKALLNAATHLRNGDREAARSVYQNNSIAYHKGSMYPKGYMKSAVSGFVEAQRPSVIRRYAAVLRFYTTLVLPETSEKQKTKAVSSITSPSTGVVPDDMLEFFHQAGANLSRRSAPLRKEQAKPWKLRPNTYQYSSRNLDREDRKVPLRQIAFSLLTEGGIPKGLEFTDPFAMLTTKIPSSEYAGRIGVIQEQGAKARVVAMPSSRIQLSFIPLHDWLARVDEGLPTSVRTDQQKAIFGLLEHMQDNLAYSTDLSSATDRFPRSLSQSMLRGMDLGIYADALEEVSSMIWESPFGDMSYSVGQPMGLYGSFPLFHLSNQVLASYAEHKVLGIPLKRRDDLHISRVDELMKLGPGRQNELLKRFPNGSTFYVLGDDIVFSDPRVKEAYVHSAKAIGLEISETKSFSGELTEFAGFMITKAQGRPFAFRPYKPPSGRRVTNPIDFMAALGVQAGRINKRWDKQVNLFSRTWSDRSPDLSPWVTQEGDQPLSRWDVAALDNEFTYLTGKYPALAPGLSQHVRYSDGTFVSAKGYSVQTAASVRNRSKDLPRVMLETNREALGASPKHPRRQPSPISSDPLMRKQKELQAQEDLSRSEQASPVTDSVSSTHENIKAPSPRILSRDEDLLDKARQLRMETDAPSPDNV